MSEWQTMGIRLQPLSYDVSTGTHAQFRDPVTPWTIDRLVVQQQLPGLMALLLGPRNGSDAMSKNRAHHLWGRVAARDVTSSSPPGTQNRGIQGNDDGPVWFSVVGALQECIGAAALYASLDMRCRLRRCPRCQYMPHPIFYSSFVIPRPDL